MQPAHDVDEIDG